jgi:hypothetical protein
MSLLLAHCFDIVAVFVDKTSANVLAVTYFVLVFGYLFYISTINSNSLTG